MTYAIAPGLLLVGIALAWVGYFPRRTGDDAYCRACGYGLRGSSGSACPECGGASVVYGCRTRRPKLAAAGFAMCAVGGLWVGVWGYGQASGINWYTHTPTWWVMRDARSSSGLAQAERGWQELQRRLQAGELSTAQERELVELAVVELEAASAGPLREEAEEYLLDQVGQPLLSPNQRQRLEAAAWSRLGTNLLPHQEARWVRLLAEADERGNLTASQRDDLYLDAVQALQHPHSNAWSLQQAYQHHLMDALRHGRLTPQQRHDVIDLALTHQAGPYTYGYNLARADWQSGLLTPLYTAGALTDSQSERLFRHAVWVHMAVRPRSGAGETVPYDVQTRARIRPPFWARLDDPWTRLDGEEGKPWAFEGEEGVSTGMDTGGRLKGLTPGRHELEIGVTLRVYEGPKGDVAASRLLGTFDRSVKRTVEVLPPGQSDLRPVNDPALRPTLQGAFQPSGVYRYGDINTLMLRFDTSALPVNTAFDVFIRIGSDEYQLTSIHTLRGEKSTPYSYQHRIPRVDHISLILRPSPAEARSTDEILEYWTGAPIIYHNVPVEHRDPFKK